MAHLFGNALSLPDTRSGNAEGENTIIYKVICEYINIYKVFSPTALPERVSHRRNVLHRFNANKCTIKTSFYEVEIFTRPTGH